MSAVHRRREGHASGDHVSRDRISGGQTPAIRGGSAVGDVTDVITDMVITDVVITDTATTRDQGRIRCQRARGPAQLAVLRTRSFTH